jgi:cellulose biosynthesis protein BcsS
MAGSLWRALRVLFRCSAVAMFLLGIPAAAFADGLQQFAGWEGDTRGQGYGFVGVGAPLTLGRHVAIPLSTSASFLYYDYDSSAANVAVRSPGVSVMSGVRLSASHGSVSLLGGGELRWERRSVSTLDNSVVERQVPGAVLQTYDDLDLGRRFYLSGFGVYVGAARYLIGRGAIRYQLTNVDGRRGTSFFVGAEGVRQGNEQSDAFEAGGFAEWHLAAQRISVAVHSGYKESWSPGYAHERGSYAAVSYYRF